jgi:hypothetical protein
MLFPGSSPEPAQKLHNAVMDYLPVAHGEIAIIAGDLGEI